MEGLSAPRSSSSAVGMHCCSSCLDGRRRDGSCLRARTFDQSLPRTRTTRSPSGSIPASAGAAEEERFALLRDLSVAARALMGEGAA